MRKFIRASVLVLALAIPAFAGNIPYGVTSPPPSPPDSITECGDMPNGATATGDIQNGVTGEIPYGASFIDALLALFSLI
jgi:hypothetical protein